MHYACLFKRVNYWDINLPFFFFLPVVFLLTSIPTLNSTLVARHLDFPISGESCDAKVKNRRYSETFCLPVSDEGKVGPLILEKVNWKLPQAGKETKALP